MSLFDGAQYTTQESHLHKTTWLELMAIIIIIMMMMMMTIMIIIIIIAVVIFLLLSSLKGCRLIELNWNCIGIHPSEFYSLLLVWETFSTTSIIFTKAVEANGKMLFIISKPLS